MVKLGELLLLIGTILFITVGFMVEIKVGMVISGILSIIWGVLILKLASLSKGGEKE